MTWKVKGSPILLKWHVLKISSGFAVLFTPIFFPPICSWNDWSSPECSLVGWSRVLKWFFEPWISSKHRVKIMLAWRSELEFKSRKKPFLTHGLLYSFSIAQAEFFICCKAITGLCKNVFFTYNFYVPRYENWLQNALFLGLFQIIKTSNLRALLTRSENPLLGNILTSLCFSYDTKHTCKRSF